jgi:hypothetical protein
MGRLGRVEMLEHPNNCFRKSLRIIEQKENKETLEENEYNIGFSVV